jgi:hypothetical protein
LQESSVGENEVREQCKNTVGRHQAVDNEVIATQAEAHALTVRSLNDISSYGPLYDYGVSTPEPPTDEQYGLGAEGLASESELQQSPTDRTPAVSHRLNVSDVHPDGKAQIGHLQGIWFLSLAHAGPGHTPPRASLHFALTKGTPRSVT